MTHIGFSVGSLDPEKSYSQVISSYSATLHYTATSSYSATLSNCLSSRSANSSSNHIHKYSKFELTKNGGHAYVSNDFSGGFLSIYNNH